ncbi:MAG TPA: SpoIID/LytB domain-containing protein [Candidatus Dormibacteraeota bacterium]|nr:SpoIID/LytB domain-containing protein [Candidatus Dormibacteraeota bacterium]
MPRRFILPLALLLSGPLANAQAIQIGVLGLFHPQELTLSAAHSEAVLVTIADQSFVLAPNTPRDIARIKITGKTFSIEIKGQILQAKEIRATSRANTAVAFVLSVPEKISRQYRGSLAITAAAANTIQPIITMDLETAVASAVLAESAPGTPLEALKAQSIVTRSYYVGGAGRHENFDFCDLTHCQSLREPPAPDSPAVQATAATQGLVITYGEKPIATMFTRSCGGRTRTPAELGLPTKSYPYFAVLCDICHKNPIRWTRRVSTEDAAILAKGEAGRLTVDRRLGWHAVPSNNFAARPENKNDNAQVLLEGIGQGHGIGLCQRGASAMARTGATFREILAHYFPNTSLTSIAPPSNR